MGRVVHNNKEMMPVETTDPKVTFDQGVFDVYLGLTASGYNLANSNRVGKIYDLACTGKWSQKILQYFCFAHINDGRVNPYWPRASILTTFSLLDDHHHFSIPKGQFSKQIAKMSNVSKAEVGEDIVSWAANLHEITDYLRATPVYSKIWALYQKSVQDEICENSVIYRQEVLAARDRLQILFPSMVSFPQVTTILNPLQADQLTDIVSGRDCVYLVTSHLSAESYVHERIHNLLDPQLSAWENLICMETRLINPVYDPMKKMMYAWDYSAESWKNVFIETLVRVLTIVVSNYGGPERQKSQIDHLVQLGFVYAKPIASSILIMDKNQPLSYEWLECCLLACTKTVDKTKE